MLKHYLKYAVRNFKSNRTVFFGSIASIFLSALCISLLFTYIYNELSMDNFHKRENDIYLLTIQQSAESEVKIIDANLYFKFNYKDYPGIENLTTIKKYKRGEIIFKYGKTAVSSEGIVADSAFFDVFDFGLKVGDRNTVLSDPNAVIFTERFAKKLFGDKDPLGQVVEMDERFRGNYTVMGIVESPPPNSSVDFDFILSGHSQFFSRSGGNFILAGKNFDAGAFKERIRNIGHVHPQFKGSRIDIMPFRDVYFNSSGADFNGIFSKFGNKKNISILSAIIAIIFIITLLNFSNLQIININSSLKNIGINEISGAGKKHIFWQKFTELVVLIIISAVLISVAFMVVLPSFNRITGVGLSPKIVQIFLLNLTILVLLVVAAMIYPSIVFRKVSLTNSLKNQIYSRDKQAGRNVVATVQFTLSFILLAASIIVVKQLHLMLHKDLGFTSKNILCINFFRNPDYTGSPEEYNKQKEILAKNYQYVRNELASNRSVESFCQGESPITPFQMPWKVKGNDKDYSDANGLSVTPDYVKVLGLEVVEGRFFEEGRDQSRGQQVVINETAKKYYGIKDISDERVLNKYWSFSETGPAEGFEIIGVVKDFNSEHLSVKPKPLFMAYFQDIDANFLIQFKEGETQSGVQFVRRLFDEVNPGETFEYTFLSDNIEAMYVKEKRLSEIYIVFTIIAYAISAIGLFAISLYDTRRRTKEIGVRKVNGAKVSEILAMLNKDFVKWVVIAFVVATPIAYYAMNKWLENFAYKTELSWWIFALAGVLALGIALLTVSWQSWREATRNPVEALRYE